MEPLSLAVEGPTRRRFLARLQGEVTKRGADKFQTGYNEPPGRRRRSGNGAGREAGDQNMIWSWERYSTSWRSPGAVVSSAMSFCHFSWWSTK